MNIIFPFGTTTNEDFGRDDIRNFLFKNLNKIKVRVWIPTDSNDGFWSTIKRKDFEENFEFFYPNHFGRIFTDTKTKTIYIVPNAQNETSTFVAVNLHSIDGNRIKFI